MHERSLSSGPKKFDRGAVYELACPGPTRTRATIASHPRERTGRARRIVVVPAQEAAAIDLCGSCQNSAHRGTADPQSPGDRSLAGTSAV